MMDLWRDFRGGLAEMRPSRFPYAKFAAALILGIAGGWLFAWLMLPLPWMLGPMTVCTLAALMKLPIAAPTVVRPPMSAVIGVMLGAAFSPDIAARLLGWLPTVIGLAFFVAASGIACVWYFRKVGRMDFTTAYFAGMPGGLVEMVIVGEQRGGDGRTIALVHSARILLVVMTLPFIVQAVEGVSLGGPDQRRAVDRRCAAFRRALDHRLCRCGGDGGACAAPAGVNTCSGRCSSSALVHFSGLTRFQATRPRYVNGAAGRSRCDHCAAPLPLLLPVYLRHRRP